MHTFKMLFALLTPKERKQVPLLLFLIFLGMLLETLGIGLVIPAIALMTQTNILDTYPMFWPLLNFIGGSSQIEFIVDGMLILLGLYILKASFLVFMTWKQNKFIYSVQSSVSNRLFIGYLKQPWSFHLQRNSAQLIRNVTAEVNIFSNTALQSGMGLITEVFVFFGIVSFLFIIEPRGTPIVMGILAVAAWGFQKSTGYYIQSLGDLRQHHDGMRIQHLQQGLGGVKDVKILGRESEFIDQFSMHNVGSAEMSRKQRTLLELPRIWFELLVVIGLVTLVFILLAQGTKPSALLPVLGLFAAAAFRIAPSANRILGSIQNLRYSLSVIRTLYEEMQLLGSTILPQRMELLSFNQNIQLENIVYRYTNAESNALNGINIMIQHGTSVGFIGMSGAGKSTLIDIILGLLTPEQGCVKIDGVDIQTNLRGWQDQIGYVPQTIFLNDDSLKRNVAFGLPDELIDNESVYRAIKSAQLDEFCSSLPQGVDTLVGERGVRLSGGQRQRIGIARALYHNPAVLVLDEATSALDMETEKEVMDAINLLSGEKTLLIIAHRLSTISNCDCVYIMENGCIIRKNMDSIVDGLEKKIESEKMKQAEANTSLTE